MFGSIFFLPLFLVFIFIYKENWLQQLKRANLKSLLSWGIPGGLFAILLQLFFYKIQRYLFKINSISFHTNDLITHAKTSILVMLLICIVCPILEEIIFRKIIFEAIKKKIGLAAAVLISSFLFSFIHFDFSNTLIYLSMGLIFTLIYVKSKNLMCPMLSHMIMNTLIFFILIQKGFN